ncbi:protein kinase-like protein [Apiospora marii]|uniref:Protein kinase-like protein n=1 Tax=Apiospora marii TaxID=335849 RepID=A0ABR1S020_9PEZI
MKVHLLLGSGCQPRRRWRRWKPILRGVKRDDFQNFMRKMLQWDSARRSTAGELFQDEWLQEQT